MGRDRLYNVARLAYQIIREAAHIAFDIVQGRRKIA